MNIVAPATTVLQRPLKYIRGEKPSSSVHIKLSGNYRRNFGDTPDFCVCVCHTFCTHQKLYFFCQCPFRGSTLFLAP